MAVCCQCYQLHGEESKRGPAELNPVVVVEKFCIREDFLASHLAVRVFIRTMIHFDTAAILDPNNPGDLFPATTSIPTYYGICRRVVTVFNL